MNTLPSPGVPADPLLSLVEVARLLNISRRGVYRLVWAGELEAIRVGNLHRFEAAAVNSFLDANRGNPSEPVVVERSEAS